MTRVLSANWNYPTRMWVGPGRIAELPAACAELGISRPLLVTDQGLRELPMVREALAALDAAGLPGALYADVRGNPVSANVSGGVDAYRDHGADGVVAFGGGSALDAAKAVALMVGQSRPLWDFEDVGDNWRRADAAAMAPVVAVPTTAGTGSEVGRAAVITDEERHEKKIIFHPRMLPGIVIADARLSIGLPPHITAATGVDAFVHCFEAYCAPGYHPMAEGIALEGMRLVASALPRAYADGGDLEARADMLTAASMGATAFQKGLGGVHALAHPIGAVYDTHHGLTNAVLLPYVMQRNRPAIEARMALLARVLGLGGSGYDAVLDWVLDLRARLGIAADLAAIGVPADGAVRIGAMAQRDPSAGGNPLTLDARAYAEVFTNAVAGRL